MGSRPPAAPTVLWDFDGTLVTRQDNWRGALLTALDRLTADHGVTMEQLRAGLRDGFPWHRPDRPHPQLDTPDRWWDEIDTTVLRAYRRAGVDETTASRAAAAVRETYLDDSYWSVFSDSRPALQRLHESGYQNVIVSNRVPELDDLVRRVGLADLIDLTLTSAATGYEKPHPVMFDLAVEAAGRPDQVWMIGNNPIADVAGATAVGIPALLVRTPAPAGLPGLKSAVDVVLGLARPSGSPLRR
jgi:putative hydrolase of the HAD superfamily